MHHLLPKKSKDDNDHSLSFENKEALPNHFDPILKEKSQTKAMDSENNILLRALGIYLVLAALLGFVLSEPILDFLDLNDSFSTWILFYKLPIFVAVTLPILYWTIKHLTSSFRLANLQLENHLQIISRIHEINCISKEIHHAILRSTSQENLLQEACDIIQKQKKLSFVWSGIADFEGNPLSETVVSAGEDKKYLRLLYEGLYLSKAKERSEPALTAIRKKHFIVVNDVESFSKEYFPWQIRAKENGYQAIAAFPFNTQSGMGVFALYASEKNICTEIEAELLREVIADVEYGLSCLAQKEQLYYAANFDVLTNLPNRKLFEDRITQAIARAYHHERYIAIVVIEICDLKKLIALHGQSASDRIVQQTCNYLADQLREGDTLARLSQNEIGIMLTDIAEINDLVILAPKLLMPIALTLPNQTKLIVKLQAGVATFPSDGENSLVLIENALHALSNIKAEDQINCGFFSKEIALGVKNNLRISQEMQLALEKEEFVLYYQPVVNLQNRQICGVEALLHWHNQKLGEISPLQFITVAEETKLIIPLGMWALKTACNQLMFWKSQGFKIPLSVNLSAKQLLYPTFIESIKTLFSELNFNPKEYALGFEITEGTIVENLDKIKIILNALRELGIEIYIDNFGLGTASLSYFHQLPVDALKIDSMFIKSVAKDQNIKTLVKGIIALANGLGVNIIAKGVETEKQFKALQQLNCKAAQGYYFSPPMMPKNVETLFDPNNK